MYGVRIELAAGVFLQQDKTGKTLLLLNEVLYEPTDVITRKENRAREKLPARVVAIDYLINRFGPNRERWPEAARSFVAPPKSESGPPTGADLPECP
jgi:hypothetical protein